MTRWVRWQDWVAVAAGLYAALGTIWSKPYTGRSIVALIVLGVLLILAALWALGSPTTRGAEVTAVILGALLFISPWVLVFFGKAGPAWTAWICGAVGIIVSVWALPAASKARAGSSTPAQAKTA